MAGVIGVELVWLEASWGSAQYGNVDGGACGLLINDVGMYASFAETGVKVLWVNAVGVYGVDGIVEAGCVATGEYFVSLLISASPFFFFPRRQHSSIATPTRIINTTAPPTAPPTMAPMGTWELIKGGSELEIRPWMPILT
jgi:hypothetical protein